MISSLVDRGFEVSGRIRRIRRSLHLEQREVAARLQALGYGVSEATYSRIEAGKVELAKGAAALIALSQALGCSPTYLLGLTEDPQRWEPDPMRWKPYRGTGRKTV